jgi:hypothetical protein
VSAGRLLWDGAKGPAPAFDGRAASPNWSLLNDLIVHASKECGGALVVRGDAGIGNGVRPWLLKEEDSCTTLYLTSSPVSLRPTLGATSTRS